MSMGKGFSTTRSYIETYKGFDIIKEKVGVIYTIANLRNLSNHGQTSNEKQMRSLSKDEIDLYFSELKQIINNYIIQYNG